MNRFVKNNLVLFIVLGVSVVVALALLVWTAIRYTQMTRYINETDKLRKQIGELIAKTPAPVDENKPRISADIDLYSKTAAGLQKRFGHPLDPAVDAFIKELKLTEKEAKAEDAPKEITLAWLKEKFHEGWDRIDANNSAQQGVFYKQFQRRFRNWPEALQEFRKLAENATTEPITEFNIDEVFLGALGIPRTMQSRPENLTKFISDFRYKLLDMLAGKVAVGPNASLFSFEENTVYQPEEYPLVVRNWDIIGDLAQKISKSGVKELTAFRKRTLAGEESGGYQLHHFSFEVIGSISNIRKLVKDIDNAFASNRVYLVRSVSLYALNDPAEALFSQENTLPQDFIDSLMEQEARKSAAAAAMTTTTPAQQPQVRGRRGRRQSVVPMEMPTRTELTSEELQVRRAQVVKEFEEAEKKKKYYERFGYGDTLIGGSDECRAVIDVDYIMQN